MAIISIIIFLAVGFLGYVVGRIGDYISDTWMNDPAWSPHHWIYGLILVAVGSYFLYNIWGLVLISFGTGVFISDLKDFWELKVIGKDNKPIDQRKFWHIN